MDAIKGEIIRTICYMVLQETGRESTNKDQLGSLILLLQNLKEFMDRKPSLSVTWMDHENLIIFVFYIIHNNVRDGNHNDDDYFSRNTLHLDIALINHEELDEVLVSAQIVAFNMACSSLLRRHGKFCWSELYLYPWNKEHTDISMRIRILKAIVLSSTTPLTYDLLSAYGECVQESLSELLNIKDFDLVKDQFSILHEGFSFLWRFLINYKHEQEKLSHFKVGFRNLVRMLGSEVCSCFSNWLRVDMANQSTVEPSQLVEMMNLIIVETGELLPLVHISKIGSKSPKTNQLGSLNILLQNWKEFMEYDSDLITTWKDQLQMIHENFVLFESFMTSSTVDEESQKLCSSILDAGHVAEYLLTTFSDGTCPARCSNLWIHEFTEHVELIKASVIGSQREKGNIKEISTAGKDQSQLSAQALVVPASTDVVVGFEVEMQLIREKLVTRPKQLDVISIVGMPGLGKTTLARKVYEDHFTTEYFDARAWCCVSQEYNKKELLLEILGSIIELSDVIRNENEANLAVMVHKELTGRRYFVVLDDIWDINAFTYLKRFFPDDKKGSRIMLTSRSKVIGTQAQCNGDIIEPCALTDEQSWDLLMRKVYNKGKCPPELCKIGMEIAKKCRGLPLAVVVVGGVLATDTHKRAFWEQVRGSLSSYLARDSKSQFLAALELSYEFLPDCLKPMFLYIGMFPEDKEILADKLMRLWLAEGFVQKTESTSLEIQAETNLLDLIDRNLVMVAKRRWDGRVKSCRVHDLLRDMCLAKAEEENFMQLVHVHGEFPDPVVYQQRLSIFLERNDETTSRHFFAYKDLPKFSITPPIYSLLFFDVGQYDIRRNGMDDCESVISSLKLLKVFDAEIFRITQDVLDKDLTMLVHLRYVSIYGEALKSIPSSISRLRKLETLIITNLDSYDVVNVPGTIWEMTKLRHLHINKYAEFRDVPDNSIILENMETLSMHLFEVGEEEKIYKKVPGLKKLKCVCNSNDQFPNFQSLGKLELLNASGIVDQKNGAKLTGQFKLPITLKKLNLDGFRLKWSQISIFKTLPNLEVLKLEDHSVTDSYWDMEEDDVFTKLKFLKFRNLPIERWSASSANFPCLEKLVFEYCEWLDDIPSDLGELNTLQKIEVKMCAYRTVERVKDIQKEQEEFENDLLKFYYYRNG